MKITFIISLLVILSFLDVYTTLIGISNGFVEDNILLSSLENNIYLLLSIMIFLKIIVIVAIYYMMKRKLCLPAYVLLALYLFVDLHNIFLLY